MLAAATLLMAGSASAGTVTLADGFDTFTVTEKWTQGLPSEGSWTKTSARGATGIPGEDAVYVVNYSDGTLVKFTATGTETLISGESAGILAWVLDITSDEEGNLIWVHSGTWNSLSEGVYVLPKGKTAASDVIKIDVPQINEEAASLWPYCARIDRLGRVLGDITGDEAYFWGDVNGMSRLGVVTFENGVATDFSTSTDLVAATNTFTVAQPACSTIDDLGDYGDYTDAAYVYTCNAAANFCGPNDSGDEFVKIAIAHDGTGYGFDTFVLDGERYFVCNYRVNLPADYTWLSGDLAIIRASDNAVVATYAADPEPTANGQNYSSIKAYPSADGKSVEIYGWNTVSGAYQLTVALPGSEPSVPALYLTGESAQVGGWDLSKCVEMNYDSATDLYSYVITSGNSFKISTNKVSWDDFDANAWTTSSILEINKETELVQGTGNLVIASYEGDLTLKVDWTNKKITAEGTPSAKNTFTVTGAFDSWTQSCSVTNTDETQTINVSAWDGGKFKILKNGAWLGNGQSLINGTEYVIDSNVDDMSLDPSATGKDITFSWVPATNTLTVTWTAEGPTTYTVAITGAFNSWNTSANSNTTETTTCDIVVENYQNAVDGQGEGFKVYFNGSWLGNGTGTDTLENGVWSGTLVANGSDDNLLLPDDANGKTVTFTYAIDTNTVRAVWEGEVVAPDHVYIIGNVNGNTDWAANNGVELTKTGATFEGEVTMAGSWFGIATELGTTEGDWETLNANRYGAATDGEAIAKYGSANFTKNTNPWNITDFSTAFENGVVKFTVDWANMVVTITAGASGIEGIAADNAAPAIYYNLQGVQVANPVAGQVYIRVAGNQASKILF